MAAIAPAAFLGSLAAAARHLPPRLVDIPLILEIDHALSRCQHLGLRLPNAASFLTLAARSPPISLQKTISSAIEDAVLRSIENSPIVSSHLVSLKQAGASGWLAAIPSRPELTLEDDDFRLAARLRLRLHPSESEAAAACSCGGELLPDHFLTCRSLWRRSVTSRHDSLLLLLVSFLRDAGLQPIPESGERPDMRLSGWIPLLS